MLNPFCNSFLRPLFAFSTTLSVLGTYLIMIFYLEEFWEADIVFSKSYDYNFTVECFYCWVLLVQSHMNPGCCEVVHLLSTEQGISHTSLQGRGNGARADSALPWNYAMVLSIPNQATLQGGWKANFTQTICPFWNFNARQLRNQQC